MHHLVVDRWARDSSPLHARHAQAKIAVLLAFLVAVSTTAATTQWAFAAYAALGLSAALFSRLPLVGLLRRAALVLPFSATFALLTWWSGDALRALALAEKSYLSGFAVLLLVATTPLTESIAALDAWHCPRALVLVIQFLYRYLFVIAEQAQRMRQAASCRRGQRGRSFEFRAAAGALGVLFARSWQRADGIHQAMLARGFQGRFVIAAPAAFRAVDGVFLAAGLTACVAVRFLL